MSLEIACFILIAAGVGILLFTAMRYHRFMRRGFADDSAIVPKRRVMEIFVRACVILFVLVLTAGAIEIFRYKIKDLYFFVGMLFFAGGTFFAGIMMLQMRVTASFRNKTVDIMRAVNAMNQKDSYIKDHSWHVYHVTQLLYEELPAELQSQLNRLKLLDAALLHDVGKINIMNEILHKPGALDSEEWRSMKEHPLEGKLMLANTCFAEIGNWVQYHHERIDGSGYYRLVGDEIPLESRVIAVADTYAAITTDRSYQPKLNHKEAVRILKNVAGSQLDPELVEHFCRIPEDQLNQVLPGENNDESYYRDERLTSHSAA